MDEHTKELLSVFAEKANGATMCGYPIAEFSRDELMGVVGQLIGEKEHWEGRAAEYLDLFSPRQIKES